MESFPPEQYPFIYFILFYFILFYFILFYLTFVHINKYKYKNKIYSNSAQGDPFGYKANLPRGPTIKLQQRRLSS